MDEEQMANDAFAANARRALDRALEYQERRGGGTVAEHGHMLWFDEEIAADAPWPMSPWVMPPQTDEQRAVIEHALRNQQEPIRYATVPSGDYYYYRGFDVAGSMAERERLRTLRVPGDGSAAWDRAEEYADAVGCQVFQDGRCRFQHAYDMESQSHRMAVTYHADTGANPVMYASNIIGQEALSLPAGGLLPFIKQAIKTLYRQLAEAVGVAFPEVLEADNMSNEQVTGTGATYGWNTNAISSNTIRRPSVSLRDSQEPARTELAGFLLGMVVRHKATGEQGVVVGFGDGTLRVDLGLARDTRFINPLAVEIGQVWQPSPRSATEASS